MAPPGMPVRPPRLSVALVSAAALGYEILLMRLFSIIQWHHFAYMIISLALLGYGASGTFIALMRPRLLARFAPVYWANLVLFGLSAVASYLLAQQLPFNAEEVLWDWRQPLWLLAIYLLLALPFFFAANAIALALSRHVDALGRIYAADLLGAGLGSLALLGLLFLVFPGTALQVLGALGALAALVSARELRLPGWRWQGAALLCAAGLLALPAAWLKPHVSPYKELSQALRVAGTEVIDRRSSPLGVLEVLASHDVPLRHAPGLSLRATAPIPQQLGLFTDAGGLSAIDRNPQQEPLDYLDQLTSALPYYLGQPQRVLILGAGGGAGIQQALNHGVPAIDAVELNPQVVELVTRDYGAWSGDLYERPGVEAHIADARGYVRRSGEHYDLIQITLLDAYGAAGAGLPALNENYLYTVEALQEYLAHIAPGGYLAISRWISLPPRDMLKLLATAVTALRQTGSASPGERLVLIRGWQTGTLLIKNAPFTAQEIEAVRRFSRARSFDVAWYPGMPPAQANRYNILRQPWFYEATRALTGSRGAAFIRDYKFDITPPTDDRPYYFHFFRWGVLPEILALRGQGGLPLLESGYLVLVATALQALLISLLLIVLPLALHRRGAPAAPPRAVSRTSVLIYFVAIGLAFLFIEIASIQKFILFLHHPLYAAATVLTAFLVFAGLGSAWTARRGRPDTARSRQARRAVAAIVVLGLAYAFLLDPLFDRLMLLPLVLRVLVAIVLIAPLAFCMGMPFPLALGHVGERQADDIPWAWAINGCASVLSAVLATLLAIQFGYTAVILLALVLYLLAAWSFP